jgi:copper chaperone CopZ
MPVHDLGCGGAGATAIERALASAPGVLRVHVNPATETAYIDFDPAQTDLQGLARVIEEAGYRSGRPLGA